MVLTVLYQSRLNVGNKDKGLILLTLKITLIIGLMRNNLFRKLKYFTVFKMLKEPRAKRWKLDPDLFGWKTSMILEQELREFSKSTILYGKMGFGQAEQQCTLSEHI